MEEFIGIFLCLRVELTFDKNQNHLPNHIFLILFFIKEKIIQNFFEKILFGFEDFLLHDPSFGTDCDLIFHIINYDYRNL